VFVVEVVPHPLRGICANFGKSNLARKDEGKLPKTEYHIEESHFFYYFILFFVSCKSPAVIIIFYRGYPMSDFKIGEL